MQPSQLFAGTVQVTAVSELFLVWHQAAISPADVDRESANDTDDKLEGMAALDPFNAGTRRLHLSFDTSTDDDFIDVGAALGAEDEMPFVPLLTSAALILDDISNISDKR